VLVIAHILLAELEPVGEEGCSGSRFTRQVGNEQPSPKLRSQQKRKERQEYEQNVVAQL